MVKASQRVLAALLWSTVAQAAASCGWKKGRPYVVDDRSLLAVLAGGGSGSALPGWGAEANATTPAHDGFAARLLAESCRGVDEAALPSGLEGTLELGKELPALLLAASEELEDQERASWHTTALNEHAAVATFARLVLELMVSGAPQELLRLAIKAQEEELMHARIAFALSGLGAPAPGGAEAGEAGSGGAALLFPEHTLTLRRDLPAMYDAAVREGLEGEGASALDLYGQAVTAFTSDPARPALGRLIWAIAKDESRHAALAGETLQWLQESSGLPKLEVNVQGGRVSVVKAPASTE